MYSECLGRSYLESFGLLNMQKKWNAIRAVLFFRIRENVKVRWEDFSVILWIIIVTTMAEAPTVALAEVVPMAEAQADRAS